MLGSVYQRIIISDATVMYSQGSNFLLLISSAVCTNILCVSTEAPLAGAEFQHNIYGDNTIYVVTNTKYTVLTTLKY